ncbi:MAG: 5-(carboxyamino)imidazole ribonucleotide synthase [Acidobacteria bacterium]|nr:5-(carboxyamino)imidazole ribonucleotide synthase [Acidobacteriota bacterium]MCB9399691.1 5-(carboxyamino)imidazole ribonucleotide synthase [Acidobacteriota bacterium]
MKVLILGSGQLARMLSLAAAPLGIRVLAVDVRAHEVVDPVTFQVQPESIYQAMQQADLISVEFEHIARPLLEQAEETGKLLPNRIAVRSGADRLEEKSLLDRLGIPTSPWRFIEDVGQMVPAAEQLGYPLVLKSCRDGYDGYGQWRLKSPDQLAELSQTLHKLDLAANPLIAEQFVAFEREVSVVGARDRSGATAIYPITENLHFEGQLRLSLAPARGLTPKLQEQAESAFHRLTTELDFCGIMAIEFFKVNGQLWVNELAPRVHNSGHWSQRGSRTSQFENHIRAVCGLPLGDTHLTCPTAMINIIGYVPPNWNMLRVPGCSLHWYEKALKPKRKLGHFNLVAENTRQLGQRLNELAAYLPAEHFPFLRETAEELLG